MIYPELESYDAFLSSGFMEFAEGIDRRGGLVSLSGEREAARELFHHHGLALWTWDYWRQSRAAWWVDGFDRERAGQVLPFEIISIFRRALIQSRMIVLFVANRRGSRIEPWEDGRATYGTYLELEIFLAISTNKPIILLREQGGAPDAPLEQLLAIARRSGAIRHEEWIARRDLGRHALAACHKLAATLISNAPRFTTLLAIRRDRNLDFRTIPPFLFGATLPPFPDGAGPDLDVIDRLLSEEQDQGLSIGERMTRLWLALQAMLPVRDRLAGEPEVMKRWLQALDRWANAASWFGLHAHLGVSPIVAHSERARLIAGGAGQTTPLPYGAIASARYSIGRRESRGLRRWRELNEVVKEAKLAFASDEGDRAGYLSIMGHAYLLTGRPLAARRTFARSLRLREAESKDERVGEGMMDLGFVHLLTLSPSRGLGMMEDGLDRLEAAGNTAFLLKSMKKLEFGYRLLRRRDAAAALRARRAQLATEAEIFDQMN